MRFPPPWAMAKLSESVSDMRNAGTIAEFKASPEYCFPLFSLDIKAPSLHRLFPPRLHSFQPAKHASPLHFTSFPLGISTDDNSRGR